MKKIVLTGGGTAGHVTPNIALLPSLKEAGYEVYDFFGISGKTDESDPLYGLYRFKKGFGGEFTEFIGEFDYVISPLGYWIWTKLLPEFKKFKKKLRNKKH